MHDGNDDQSIHGHWVMRGAYENPVSGRLKFGNRNILTIYGSKLDETTISRLRFQSISTIIGESDGREVSLLGLQINFYDPNGVIEFDVETAIIGTHVSDDHDFTIQQACFELDNLVQWTRRGPISSSIGPDVYGFTYTPPVAAQASITRGVVAVEGSVRSRISRTGAAIEHRDSFHVSLREAVTLDSFLYDFARPLRYLLALAVGPLPRIYGLDALIRRNGAGSSLPVALYPTGRAEGSSGLRASFADMMFTLPDIDFGELVPRWFDIVSRFDSVCDLLFDRTRGFITNRFFDVASAVEAAHHEIFGSRSRATNDERARIDRIVERLHEEDREWARSRLGQSLGPNYQTRLRELVDYVGTGAYLYTQGGGIGGLDSWCDLAAEYRNKLAHSRSVNSISWQDLAYMESSLSGLLRLVLFRQLGYSPDECHRISAQQLRSL